MTSWEDAAKAAGFTEERDEDLALLRALVGCELRDYEESAFEDMLAALENTGEGARAQLTDVQRAWAREVGERVGVVASPFVRLSHGAIPRGREVPTPAVLQNLPKRPPGRR